MGAYVGFDAEPLSSSTARAVPGLYVTAVDPGGPAAAAGISAGDIVTRINGATATSTGQLVELTLRQRPGAKVTLEVDHSGRHGTVTVTLGNEP